MTLGIECCKDEPIERSSLFSDCLLVIVIFQRFSPSIKRIEITPFEIFRRPDLFILILEAVETIEVLCRKIQMPAKFTSANHIALFEGRKQIQIEVVNNIPILTDFQVCTGKYKARVFKYSPTRSGGLCAENKGFVFSSTDLEIS